MYQILLCWRELFIVSARVWSAWKPETDFWKFASDQGPWSNTGTESMSLDAVRKKKEKKRKKERQKPTS